MKIRILDNALRFRLTRSEVNTLCTKGYIEGQTIFDTAVFTYAVKLVKDSKQLTAQFKNNTITLNLPRSLGNNWHRTEQVGFSETMEFGDNRNLSLLLEKDFACLDERLEDQSDNYPNPKALL
ncbi:hypothetical protein [uncultured Eudoraea sp.]|uniref:DUF7009 family protein n=1 Tax=uncultured Eudoraea sp. TaxID=1035614 RepID=UPI00262A0000|nr:hypothetical protein [uncultured Eudoraea sp.]